MSFLKSWLKDAPELEPGDAAKAPQGLASLVEFISRKREGQNKKTEAERRKRAAAVKAYERVKRGA